MKTEGRLIQVGSTIKNALEKLNQLGDNLTLFAVDFSLKLVGTITDGDIRRSMLNGASIDELVDKVMNTRYTFIKEKNISLEEIEMIRKKKLTLVPVVDSYGRVLRIVNFDKVRTILPADAVIMAGGEGRRLRPMTERIPKPLLKIGDKPIIEYNVDRLSEYGIENCFITIKYLGEQIRQYFGSGSAKEMKIKYIEENGEALGTIGSISLIEKFEHDTVIVMNSDLLTNIDFEDFFTEFKKRDADMAVATVPYQVKVPYAVLETNQDLIVGFKEKPTYTYFSNAGIYLLKRDVVNYIPKGGYFNATDLMDHLISNGGKVMTYPLYCYWLDIGKPEDFKKAQEDIQHIRF